MVMAIQTITSAHLRLMIWIRAGELDQRLANGECAEADGLLAMRARRLVSAEVRERFARSLRDIVIGAEGPAFRVTIPVAWDRVSEAEDEIRRLASRLQA